MNNASLTKILIFLSGIIFGSICTNLYMKKKCEDTIQEEVESMREHYKEKEQSLSDDIYGKGHDDPGDKGPEGPAGFCENDIVEYSNMIKSLSYTAESSGDEDFELHLAERTSPGEDDIFLIEEGDFFRDFNHHRKITISFYDEDSVFSDDQEEPIDDIIGTIGRNSFEPSKTDPDVMYVRNMRRSTDYEVILVHGNYARDVLGLSEEDALK